MAGISGLGGWIISPDEWNAILGEPGSTLRTQFGWVIDVVDAISYVLIPLLIVVGAAGRLGQLLPIRDIRQEHGMRPQVNGLKHLGGEVGVGIVAVQIHQAVGAAPQAHVIPHLVRIPAGLESKMAKRVKSRLLGED